MDSLSAWLETRPVFPAACAAPDRDLERDTQRATAFYQQGEDLLCRLPARPERTENEKVAAESIKHQLRSTRTEFLRTYVEDVYRRLTRDYADFVRVTDLVYLASERFPELTPTHAAVDAESQLRQGDKDGIEIDQGLFLSAVLSHPRAGAHLVHAMLRPHPQALDRLEEFRRIGRLDLGGVVVERHNQAGHLLFSNPEFLNAEDDSTTEAIEIGVDLILLDPEIEVGVLRGGIVDHPRYRGHRIFSAGINLTHLYQGKISYLFYLTRDLGYVNKLYRGLSPETFAPCEPETTLEKPWIAAVEAFAIGGGCQLLLVVDHVMAEEGSFFNLPARKEGIIPGAANLRLPRLVGDRLARRAILFDYQFKAGTPEGALLCDEVIPAGQMDAAIDRAVDALTGSGVVSAAGNRKALRVGQEPLETFRAYMATYAREQAYCHFSDALIRNLEANWNARKRNAPIAEGRR